MTGAAASSGDASGATSISSGAAEDEEAGGRLSLMMTIRLTMATAATPANFQKAPRVRRRCP
jgi:hypothetical protein